MSDSANVDDTRHKSNRSLCKQFGRQLLSNDSREIRWNSELSEISTRVPNISSRDRTGSNSRTFQHRSCLSRKLRDKAEKSSAEKDTDSCDCKEDMLSRAGTRTKGTVPWQQWHGIFLLTAKLNIVLSIVNTLSAHFHMIGQ